MSGSHGAELVCDFDLSSLIAVRHEVECISRGQGLTDLALYRFVVAVNEIMTNAVRHGGGRGQLRLWQEGGRLYCRITDRGPGMTVSAPSGGRLAPPGTTSGRGLWLARHNVSGFTLRTSVDGTSVTLEATPAR
jgi:anti-sigma regulatory factor (Ser/Thr protein kinase)